MKIIIITPARNEEEYIRTTLECMKSQTIKPIKWIIVDDGSKDKTNEIIKEYENQMTFLEYMFVPDRGYRHPGQGVVESFYKGFNKISGMDYDIISKFDADQKFPADMLEKIIEAFEKDEKLGIAGPMQYEQINNQGEFKKVLSPSGYVSGPHKFYRKQCFQNIQGLIPRAGWDGVDIIKASMSGWRTGEIMTTKIYHLKTTGMSKGEGLRKASEKYGDVSYYMGGYLWYFILRVIKGSIFGRNPMVGIYMLKGYINSKFKSVKQENMEFKKHLKQLQIENTIEYFKNIFK